MEKTKLIIRISRHQLQNAKHYAATHHTTLTSLIQAYLNRIPAQPPFENAPLVLGLSGILSLNVSEDDYKRHLEGKYNFNFGRQ